MTMQWGGLVFGWLLQSAMWLIQWRRRDAGTVDVGWTAGVGRLGTQQTTSAFCPWFARQEESPACKKS